MADDERRRLAGKYGWLLLNYPGGHVEVGFGA